MLVASLVRNHEPATRLTPLTLELLIRQYCAQNLFVAREIRDDIELPYLNNCIKLANEKYGCHLAGVTFNTPTPSQDHANIYFFSSDPKGLLQEFKNDCVSLGYRNIILCDSDYLDRLAVAKPIEWPDKKGEPLPPGFQPGGMFDNVVQAYASYRWLWILGHEIGHIARHHGARHFVLVGEPSHFVISRNYDSDEHFREELQADDFAVEAVHDELLFSIAIYSAIMEKALPALAEQNALRSGDLGREAIASGKYRLSVTQDSPFHPPYIVRGIRILRQLWARFNLGSGELQAELDGLAKSLVIE